MARHSTSRGRHHDRFDYYSSESDDYDVIERERRIRDIKRTKSRERSTVREIRERSRSPENIIINNRLNVPGQFPEPQRQSNTQPIVLVPQAPAAPAERSSSRSVHHHYHRSSSSSRSRSRSRSKRRLTLEDMPYDVRRNLEKLEELKIENARIKAQTTINNNNPAPAQPKPEDDDYKRWRRERDWERGREYEKAKDLEKELEKERAELDRARRTKNEKEAWEVERERAEYESKRRQEEFRRKIEDQKREDEIERKRQQEEYRRKLEDQKLDDDRKRSEYRRLLEEQERDEERKREEYKRLLEDKARKEAEARARYVKEAEEKAKAEAAEKKRIAEEAKLAEELKAKERKAEEERIIREHEEKLKEKEKADKELRERIIAEEKERERKEAEKKKKEEEEFEEQIRLRALRAGWSEEYVEELISNNKEKHHRHHSHSRHRSRSPSTSKEIVVINNSRETMIENERPTWIRINRKHILPETLDAYRLKWDFDADDDEFIVIKEYIDHDLQRELFAHTKKIMKSRRLITEGFTRETVTTLKPNEHLGRSVNVVKGKDKMYLVRNKSRSPAPESRRRSFLFS